MSGWFVGAGIKGAAVGKFVDDVPPVRNMSPAASIATAFPASRPLPPKYVGNQQADAIGADFTGKGGRGARKGGGAEGTAARIGHVLSDGEVCGPRNADHVDIPILVYSDNPGGITGSRSAAKVGCVFDSRRGRPRVNSSHKARAISRTSIARLGVRVRVVRAGGGRSRQCVPGEESPPNTSSLQHRCCRRVRRNAIGRIAISSLAAEESRKEQG